MQRKKKESSLTITEEFLDTSHVQNFLSEHLQITLCSYIDLATSATWAKFRQSGVDQILGYSFHIEPELLTPTFIIHKTSIVTHCSERGELSPRGRWTNAHT